MTRDDAIKTLQTRSCYECAYGCDSADSCENENCYLREATLMAIEALEENKSLAKSLNDAIELIHKLQKKNEWISVAEKLPPEGEVVWVTIWGTDCIRCKDGEDILSASERLRKEIQYTTIALYDGNGEWNNYSGYPLMVAPVAWMPMNRPEPYKEENK